MSEGSIGIFLVAGGLGCLWGSRAGFGAMLVLGLMEAFLNWPPSILK